MDKKSPVIRNSFSKIPIKRKTQALHRYACARAADAGAVSAFLTASSNVDATKRTLWTWEGTIVSTL